MCTVTSIFHCKGVAVEAIAKNHNYWVLKVRIQKGEHQSPTSQI
jgi:hypothetical protein